MREAHGREVSLESIQEAVERIRPFIHRTALSRNRTLSDICGREVYLKLENLQKTGSFKIRGALNKLCSLSPEEKSRGVITASAGNHAQGVALGARAAGIPAVVVMPAHAPAAKARATEAYGARVVLYGDSYDEAYAHACALQAEMGMTFVHAFDDDAVIAGQGTIAVEILSGLFDVDAIVAPVGGGGLISGLAVAAKQHNPRIQVIGVQAAGAPSMAASLTAGRVCALPAVRTMADGIAVKRPGDVTFDYVRRYVDDIVLVSEEDIRHGILFMLERGKMIAEGAGIAGVAALLAGKVGGSARKVAVVLSGGNIDPVLLSQLIADAAAATGAAS